MTLHEQLWTIDGLKGLHADLSREALELSKRQVGSPENRRKLAQNVADRLRIEGRLGGHFG